MPEICLNLDVSRLYRFVSCHTMHMHMLFLNWDQWWEEPPWYFIKTVRGLNLGCLAHHLMFHWKDNRVLTSLERLGTTQWCRKPIQAHPCYRRSKGEDYENLESSRYPSAKKYYRNFQVPSTALTIFAHVNNITQKHFSCQASKVGSEISEGTHIKLSKLKFDAQNFT